MFVFILVASLLNRCNKSAVFQRYHAKNCVRRNLLHFIKSYVCECCLERMRAYLSYTFHMLMKVYKMLSAVSIPNFIIYISLIGPFHPSHFGIYRQQCVECCLIVEFKRHLSSAYDVRSINVHMSLKRIEMHECHLA